MKKQKHLYLATGLTAGALLLSACGGGSGSGTGTISLSLTDGPVDHAMEVVVQFDAVRLKPAGGDEIRFEFDEPKVIDLLALQGSNAASLLENETVPAGEYNWIRLEISAEQGVVDSYILYKDSTQDDLIVPSGSQQGLRLVSGFTIAPGGSADFVIDFDLRKSLTDPPGQDGVFLKPALRLINRLETGTLAGTIDDNLVIQSCENVQANDGAVYLYTGEVTTATDIRSTETDPLTTALVHYNNEAHAYEYEIGFLEAGDYSIAYTCDNELDHPEEINTEMTFSGLAQISIVTGETTEHDFMFQ